MFNFLTNPKPYFLTWIRKKDSVRCNIFCLYCKTALTSFPIHSRWRKWQMYLTLHHNTSHFAFCSLCAFLLHTFSSFPLLALSLAALRLFFFSKACSLALSTGISCIGMQLPFRLLIPLYEDMSLNAFIPHLHLQICLHSVSTLQL